jgi:hypothetical protein
LLSGKEPEVLEALVFEPGPLQSGLQPITLSGHAARTIDPSNEDFYKRLIEWRQEVKRARDAASGAEWETLDAEQNALKIAANATSYGIFVEIIVEEVSNKVRLRVHHATGEPFELSGKKCEKPDDTFTRCWQPSSQEPHASCSQPLSGSSQTTALNGRSATPTAWRSPNPR